MAEKEQEVRKGPTTKEISEKRTKDKEKKNRDRVERIQ